MLRALVWAMQLFNTLSLAGFPFWSTHAAGGLEPLYWSSSGLTSAYLRRPDAPREAISDRLSVLSRKELHGPLIQKPSVTYQIPYT